jgi:hypothetical protein
MKSRNVYERRAYAAGRASAALNRLSKANATFAPSTEALNAAKWMKAWSRLAFGSSKSRGI